ncbi:hypothetical protein C8Q80DRAFT_774942 [Daedaleopsis nitida]|nr:hypothetical protein C8Q80DRAFT_774942 [Daedaleopsis nitida]
MTSRSPYLGRDCGAQIAVSATAERAAVRIQYVHAPASYFSSASPRYRPERPTSMYIALGLYSARGESLPGRVRVRSLQQASSAFDVQRSSSVVRPSSFVDSPVTGRIDPAFRPPASGAHVHTVAQSLSHTPVPASSIFVCGSASERAERTLRVPPDLLLPPMYYVGLRQFLLVGDPLPLFSFCMLGGGRESALGPQVSAV